MLAGAGKKCRVGKDCPVNRAIIAGSTKPGGLSLRVIEDRLQDLPSSGRQQGWMRRNIHATPIAGSAVLSARPGRILVLPFGFPFYLETR